MLTLSLIVALGLGQTGVCKPGVACQSYSHKATAPSGSTAYSLNEGASICLNPSGRLLADAGNARCDNTISYNRDPVTGLVTQGLVVTTDGGMTINAGGAASTALGLRVNGSVNIGTVGTGVLTSLLPTGASTIGGALSLSSATAMTLNASNVARVPVTVIDTEGLRLQGVTTANLTPPDGGFAGTLQYDTTTNKMVLVENNTWKSVVTSPSGYVPGATGSAQLNLAPVAAGGYVDSAINVTGMSLANGDTCTIGASGAFVAGMICNAYPNGATAVVMRCICSNAATACDAADQMYYVNCFRGSATP